LQTKRLAFVRGVRLFGGGNTASCGGSVWRIGIRMMESPKALPSSTANRMHPPPQHRNRTHPLERRITPSANPTYVGWASRAANRFPYDGIAEGASVVYREPAASTTQHRNRTHSLASDYAFG